MNGQPINYSKLGRDIGAGVVSEQAYYQILEDTLLGFRLEPFHESLSKLQTARSKFYFFDIGVQRALFNLLNVDLVPGTFAYGQAFEYFMFNYMIRLSSSGRRVYPFSTFFFFSHKRNHWRPFISCWITMLIFFGIRRAPAEVMELYGWVGYRVQ